MFYFTLQILQRACSIEVLTSLDVRLLPLAEKKKSKTQPDTILTVHIQILFKSLSKCSIFLLLQNRCQLLCFSLDSEVV